MESHAHVHSASIGPAMPAVPAISSAQADLPMADSAATGQVAAPGQPPPDPVAPLSAERRDELRAVLDAHGIQLGRKAWVTDWEDGGCDRRPPIAIGWRSDGHPIERSSVPDEVVVAGRELVRHGELGPVSSHWAVAYDSERASDLEPGDKALVFPVDVVDDDEFRMVLVTGADEAMAKGRPDRGSGEVRVFRIGAMGREWGEVDFENLSDRWTRDIGSVVLACHEGDRWQMVIG